MRKIIRVILISVLIFALAVFFISCGEKEQNGSNSNGDNNNPESPDSSGDEIIIEETDPDMPELPKIDMQGKVFTLLTYDDWGGSSAAADVYAGELNGEPINDAAYNRRIKLEQEYNCQIRVAMMQTHNDAVDAYRTAVLADDTSYDFAITAGANFTSLLSGNYLMDFGKLSYIDMDKPYWDRNYYDAMSIAGRNFAVSGDISKRRLECVWLMCFNKDILAANNLESPYALVESGRWTYEKMHEMAKAAAKDVNGDGVMTLEDDIWGLNYTGDTIMGIINCVGVKLVEVNSDGIPELTVGTEVNLERLYRIYTTMRDHTYSIDTLFKAGGGLTDLATDIGVFAENRCLFLAAASHNASYVPDKPSLRQMEVNFGIIPYPKWDTAQESYTPYTAGNYHPVITVPQNNPDIDSTGIILEAMAYEGSKELKPAYYDSLLKTKSARDAESEAMIDYLFDNLSYDMGVMYNFGGIGGVFGYDMSTNLRANIVSVIERNSGVWQRAIDAVVDEIEKNN